MTTIRTSPIWSGLWCLPVCLAAELTIELPRQPRAGDGPADTIPASVRLDLADIPGAAKNPAGLRLKSAPGGSGPADAETPCQFESDSTGSAHGRLWFVPSPGDRERGASWTPRLAPTDPFLAWTAKADSTTGRWTLAESNRPVLVYQYGTNRPGPLLAKVHPDNLKYAQPRGDYLHPLFGLQGEELTADWSVDHPHHRGIYWAWPEVEYAGNRGDLHALQRVFARPTGECRASTGPLFAQIQAVNLWLWDDREPIVREQATLRAWTAGSSGRFVDLEFEFTALKDGVTLARRDTRLYGGLNLRFSAVREQQIATHSLESQSTGLATWGDLSGFFPAAGSISGVAIFPHPANPDYPGDWVRYPDLNWLQPTFPAAGSRYPLAKDRPLALKYRLWIHAGRPREPELTALWTAYAHPVKAAVKLQ